MDIHVGILALSPMCKTAGSHGTCLGGNLFFVGSGRGLEGSYLNGGEGGLSCRGREPTGAISDHVAVPAELAEVFGKDYITDGGRGVRNFDDSERLRGERQHVAFFAQVIVGDLDIVGRAGGEAADAEARGLAAPAGISCIHGIAVQQSRATGVGVHIDGVRGIRGCGPADDCSRARNTLNRQRKRIGSIRDGDAIHLAGDIGL